MWPQRFLLCIGMSLVLSRVSIAEPDERHLGLSEFFSQLDTDRDGQIQAAEAMQYIGQEFGDAEYPAQELEAAVQRMESKLDSSDVDATVSQAEVEAHLRNLMQARQDIAEPMQQSTSRLAEDIARAGSQSSRLGGAFPELTPVRRSIS